MVYITVRSDQSNPSRFTSNLQINELNGLFEIAVKSIYHGPAANITETENKFCMLTDEGLHEFIIPVAFYASTSKILLAIYEVLKATQKDDYDGRYGHKIPVSSTYTYKAGRFVLRVSGVRGFTVNNNCTLLKYVGSFPDTAPFKEIEVRDFPLAGTVEAGFLFANIVSNSLVAGVEKRLLSMIPINSSQGFNFYEFKNPSYKQLSVDSFNNINFSIENFHGHELKIDQYFGNSFPSSISEELTLENTHYYPTIINLHIRSQI